jgi:hypothetical protein
MNYAAVESAMAPNVVVQIDRDLIAAESSWAGLIEEVRRLYFRDPPTQPEIKRTWAGFWERARSEVASPGTLRVSYDRLLSRPELVVEQVLEAANLPVTRSDIDAVRSFTRRDPLRRPTVSTRRGTS